MDAKSDKVDIIPQVVAEPVGGARPEPEEMPARRVIEVGAPAHSNQGDYLGQFSTKIVYEDTVQTMAQGMRSPCHACRYWNHEKWEKMYPKWQFDPLKKNELNNMRHHLMSTQNEQVQTMHSDNEGDFDTEHAIRSMGVCHAYSEIVRDTMLTHPLSCCPEEMPIPGQFEEVILADGTKVMRPKMEKAPFLFLDKNMDTAKFGLAIYDKVMRLAVGKK